MPLFHYRATDAGGAIVTGTLEAREERLVVQHLQQGGLIPLRVSLEEEQPQWAGLPSIWWRRRRVPFRSVVHFTQELAALLKAGLPLDRSLKALLEVTSRPAMKASADPGDPGSPRGQTVLRGPEPAPGFFPGLC
jgi:general secretion pathway protein F